VPVTAPTLRVIPACIIVGALGGLLGAIFVEINNQMAFFRKFYITKKWQRPLESAVFSLLTTTCFFWTPFVFAKCISNASVENEETKELLVTYTCPEGYYNPLATMFFNTEGGAISSIISGQESKGVQISSFEMFIYMMVWYLFTITTYGVWVPAGLFLPGMIIGCALGSLYELLREDIMGDSH
jgi:chloride channel 7